MLSTRNQLQVKIKQINADNIMAEVIMDINGQEMCAIITNGSVKRLGLKVGDEVKALIKATSVMIMRD
jgi:molybdopterin-binding protein